MKAKVLASPNRRLTSKPFTAHEVAHILGIGCTQTASRLLVEMADKDYSIQRTTPSQMNTLRFEKRKTNLLTRSWRSIPNEVLLEELL